jgi:hypothetical protein
MMAEGPNLDDWGSGARSGPGLAAVIDANGTLSHVPVFGIDEDGNFTLKGLATINNAATNGVAIIRSDDRIDY